MIVPVLQESKPPTEGKVASAAESPNLDLLRTIAVMSVFSCHLLATFVRPPRAVFLMSEGGVLIFFAHTSLVLMMSMQRLSLSGWRLFASFYTRRVFRLYPLSTVCVLAVVLFRVPPSTWEPVFHRVGWRALCANLALVTNLTHSPLVSSPLWSLPYEIQMYLVLPMIFQLLRKFRSPAAALILWAAGAGTVWASGEFHVRAGILSMFGPGIPWFLAGVVAYQIRNKAPKPVFSFWVWPLCVILLISAYAFSTSNLDADRRSPLCALAMALLFPFCREVPLRWLRAAAHAIAKYSYGIYLSHLPIMWLAFIRLRSLPAAARWIIFAALAIATPVIAYHLLEKPMIDFGAALAKRRFSGKERARAADRRG